MGTITELVKLQLENKYDLFRTKSPKKMLTSLALILLLLAGLCLGVFIVLKKIATLGFKINTELLGLIIMITQVISLLFGLGNIVFNLYMSKDNEFLVVLPATANQMFISKLLVVYIQELLINTLYTLPFLLVVGILGKFAFYYYLFIPLILIVLPIFPIVVASLLSIPAVYLVKFFKKKLILSLIVMVILISVALILYMEIVSNFTANFSMANLRQQIETVMSANNKIIGWASHSFLYFPLCTSITQISKIWILLLFILACAGLFVGMFFLIKPFYFKLMLSSMENTKNDIRANKKWVKEDSIRSLIKKEFLSVFRSNNYVFQFFLFVILMPVIVVAYDKFILGIAVSKAGQIMVVGSHLIIMSIVTMLANVVSASAFSREGASFYLIKVSPVSYYKQTVAKMLFNMILTYSAIIVTTIITFFYLPWWQVLLTMFACLFSATGHICYSLDADLKNPELKWYGTEEMSGVTKSTTKSIIWGLIISFIMGFFMILTTSLNPIITWGILVVGTLIFALRRMYVLFVRTSYQYDRLEM